MSDRKLVDKSITNIAWSYMTLFSTKILDLVAIIIISNHVLPEEFGLMAFALVLLGYFELTQGFGMSAYLISRRDEIDKLATAVFYFTVTISILIFVLLWYSAHTVGTIFDQPEIAPILRILSLSLLIEALGQVHNNLLQRELRFRLKMWPDIGRGLVKGLLGIGLAIGGFGVWALVYAHIAGTLAWTVSLWFVRPWRPRGIPSLGTLKPAVLFGSNMVVAALANAVPRTLDQILIAKFLGPSSLGLYALANRMPKLALKSFGMQANNVLFPAMSKLQTDKESMRLYYYGTVRYFSIIIFSMGVGIALVTPSLITTIYAKQWHEMIPTMQILSIAFALAVVNGLPGNLYKALGRSDYFLASSLINLPLVAFILYISVGFGIESVAVAHIVLVFVIYFPNFLMLRRLIGITAVQTFQSAWPGVLCAFATAGGGLVAFQVTPVPDLMQLLTVIVFGLVSYFTALWFLAPEVFSEVLRLCRKLLIRVWRS